MPDINIVVRNKIAQLTRPLAIVCDNSNYTLAFDFDEEWTEYGEKTARIYRDDKTYSDVLFNGNTCAMPDIKHTHVVTVGVYAGNIRTTTPAYIPCLHSILGVDGAPAAPGEDIYNQIMERLNDLELESVNPEQISEAVSVYLEKNPVQSGATAEQAAQIELNKSDIANLRESLDSIPGGDPGKDGIGISNIEYFSPDSQGGNVYVITLTDGSTYNFTAPRGAQGEAGRDGEPGQDGVDGKSAYEIALENGFVGTEQEWLASLKGEQGAQGIQGIQGEPGADGADGAPGADGQDGADGYTPVKGTDYYTDADKAALLEELAAEAAVDMSNYPTYDNMYSYVYQEIRKASLGGGYAVVVDAGEVAY